MGDRGLPRRMMMPDDAGQQPPAGRKSKPKVVVGRPHDPLGYDTSDFWAYARQVADDALSGRNRDAVEMEVQAVERRLGIRKEAKPG